MFFLDRRDAGSRLAEAFSRDVRLTDAVILALPRGGVPVAYEIARRLELPMDVFLVHKVALPGEEEAVMGTVASGGTRVMNDDVITESGIPPSVVDFLFEQEAEELVRREKAYRDGAPPLVLTGKTVVLVDDGLATGATMRAAAAAVRKQNPSRLISAVPVAAPATIAELAKDVDEIVCVAAPEPFNEVSLWYRDFEPASDEVVKELMERSRERELAVD